MDKINMINVQQHYLHAKFGKRKQEKQSQSFSPYSFWIRIARFCLAAAVILFLAFQLGVYLYG